MTHVTTALNVHQDAAFPISAQTPTSAIKNVKLIKIVFHLVAAAARVIVHNKLFAKVTKLQVIIVILIVSV